MKGMQKSTGVFAILASALILVGCSTNAAQAQPTQDVSLVRTEAAQTVVADITIQAALNVTPTPASTATPEAPQATATLEPSPTSSEPTSTAIPSMTPLPTTAPATNKYPTATQAAYAATLVSSSPYYGEQMPPSHQFDGSWTFKNTGTYTWNSHYYLRADTSKGVNLSNVDHIYLKGDVAPGDTVTVIADMTAPSTGGIYNSYWQLCNDNGDILATVFASIQVK